MAVHPHVRGEYRRALSSIVVGGGSSPRAWGIPDARQFQRCPTRFIPTCVGNTDHYAAPVDESAVHPHVRGEYGGVKSETVVELGSSPRAWGILEHLESSRAECRFIPTCVGNTTNGNGTTCTVAVHPHVRGEYCIPCLKILQGRGSSPRAWGIPNIMEEAINQRRFIPTCVGNTARRWPGSCGRPVHPHVRGEYWPRPAAAWLRTVHPHVRGEYWAACLVAASVIGSSPRAWGIRVCRPYRALRRRFIPTCVGNTAFTVR